MEFAAALITLSGPQEEHRQHTLKAIAGAKTDPLLAQRTSPRISMAPRARPCRKC